MNIKHISDLKSFLDIANFLEVKNGYLRKIIIDNKINNYTEFKIPKKDGTSRTIHKPTNELLCLQIKLKELLEMSFNPHYKSHGFIKNRDFVTNASHHINKKFVLNLDLENYFDSISFGRVRHMFIAYFKLEVKVASTLANICCHHKGFLPQGAPTSPIISNIITKTLDKQLTKLAKICPLTYYTRYADDITFSSNSSSFPIQLANINPDKTVTLSDTLIDFITNNGFTINSRKVRLQSAKEHQEVTGITVNSKINIDRRYIKNLRAIMHSFKINKDNPSIPLSIFKEKYKLKDTKTPVKNFENAFNIIKGRINHVSHVRGTEDTIYIKLAKNFNHLLEIYSTKISNIKLPISTEEYFKKNSFVISTLEAYSDPAFMDEKGNLDNMCYGQGSGFYMRDIGLITNYHVIDYLVTEVLEKGLNFCEEFYLEYYSEVNGIQKSQKAKILFYDKSKDIAILEPKYKGDLNEGFIACLQSSINDSIKLLGFPDHEIGSELRIELGKIIRRRHTNTNSRFEVSTNIYAGNSGGPILNLKNQVIGIAVRGFTEKGVVPSEFIPISEAIDLYKKHTESLKVLV